MDVDSAAPAAQSQLRTPESNPGAVTGHHPHRLAVEVPSLNHRETENVGVKMLRRSQVVLLEHELAHPRDRNNSPAVITASVISGTAVAWRRRSELSHSGTNGCIASSWWRRLCPF